MESREPNAQSTPPHGPLQGRSSFETTKWTIVRSAKNLDSQVRAAALEDLCQRYWYPLYAYVRRRGYTAAEAQDLTQEFFHRLLSKDYLRAADSEKGRFRTFLLVAMKRFLANEWHRSRAQKRGGGKTLVPIDQGWAEESYHHEPVDDITPESLYERRWAMLLLEGALTCVREEMESSGKAQLYASLKHTLGADGSPAQSYAEIGQALDMSEGSVKAAAHRMRKRFRENLRMAITETVSSAEEVEDEIRHLFAIFAG